MQIWEFHKKRERVFFFAVRKDINVLTGDIFGCEPCLNLDIKEKHITIGEIESDYKGKEPTEFVKKQMNSYIVGDSSLGDIRQRLENKPTSFQTYIIRDDDVCNTLRAGRNDFIRPEHNNINLSDYELKQIGSWSLDYDFKKQKVIYVLGMSVPPLAMYRIS